MPLGSERCCICPLWGETTGSPQECGGRAGWVRRSHPNVLSKNVATIKGMAARDWAGAGVLSKLANGQRQARPRRWLQYLDGAIACSCAIAAVSPQATVALRSRARCVARLCGEGVTVDLFCRRSRERVWVCLAEAAGAGREVDS